MPAQLGPIIARTILAAAIGMMDQPLARTPHRESLTQGGESQIAVQTIAGGPANNLSREQLDVDSKVEPPLGGPDIGDVYAPFLVRSRSGKILIDDVWCDRPGMIAVSRPFEPPLLPSLQAIFTHQPRRSPSSHGEAVILQLARHPRTAIKCRSTVRTRIERVPATPCPRADAGWLADLSLHASPVYRTCKICKIGRLCRA